MVRHKYLVLRNAHKTLKINEILRGSSLEVILPARVGLLKRPTNIKTLHRTAFIGFQTDCTNLDYCTNFSLFF